MAWKTFAEGTSFDDLALIVEDRELPKGTPVRFVMDLRLPVGRAFDLAGAELIFQKVIPEGLILKDVYGEGDWKVVVECESDPAFLAAIVPFIIVNWKFLALATIGITVGLGILISSIRGEMPFTELKDITKYLFWGSAIFAGILVFKELRK